MNTAISAKNHYYLWYRDYRDSRHLDDSTIVRYFLETTITGLHFAADNIGLSSLKFFWWAPEFLFISARGAFQHTCYTERYTSYSNSIRLSERLYVARGYCVNTTQATNIAVFTRG